MNGLYSISLQIYVTLLNLAKAPSDEAVPLENRKTCCNGILGFPGVSSFLPCSDLKCCDDNETVALERVNHAVGFGFRCVPGRHRSKQCYTVDQEVATTNDTPTARYELRTCCQGLKFKVILQTNDTAMIIKCVRR